MARSGIEKRNQEGQGSTGRRQWRKAMRTTNGDRRRKRNPKEKVILWVALVRQERRQFVGNSDISGGEVSGDGGLDDGVMLDEDGGKHRVGDNARIIEIGLGRPEMS